MGRDLHRVAGRLAESAGQALVALRAELTSRGADASSFKAAGDAASQEVLAAALAREHPDDAVLSEEAHDDPARLSAQRVWIIDPLDGTREFSEPPRDDWAVHVAVWEHGAVSAGAVALPARGVVYRTDDPALGVPPRPAQSPLRLAVSRSRPPAFVVTLQEALGATLVPMGSAGVKAMSVVDGTVDAYVHAGGQYEWDSAAPVAVAKAVGLHASRIDGSELTYNATDPWLPDLVVCRPELADQVLRELRNLSDDFLTRTQGK